MVTKALCQRLGRLTLERRRGVSVSPAFYGVVYYCSTLILCFFHSIVERCLLSSSHQRCSFFDVTRVLPNVSVSLFYPSRPFFCSPRLDVGIMVMVAERLDHNIRCVLHFSQAETPLYHTT